MQQVSPQLSRRKAPASKSSNGIANGTIDAFPKDNIRGRKNQKNKTTTRKSSSLPLLFFFLVCVTPWLVIHGALNTYVLKKEKKKFRKALDRLCHGNVSFLFSFFIFRFFFSLSTRPADVQKTAPPHWEKSLQQSRLHVSNVFRLFLFTRWFNSLATFRCRIFFFKWQRRINVWIFLFDTGPEHAERMIGTPMNVCAPHQSQSSHSSLGSTIVRLSGHSCHAFV